VHEARPAADQECDGRGNLGGVGNATCRRLRGQRSCRMRRLPPASALFVTSGSVVMAQAIER